MPRLNQNGAKKILSTVRPDKSFWINNGPIVNNLKDLPKSVEQMNEEQFRYHVNKDKNDFSNWIEEILGDKALAKELRRTRTKNSFLIKLKKRVNALKKIAS